MNKNYIILYLFFICSLSFGQKKTLKHADKLFTNKAYIEAAEIYKQLEPTNEILEKLGDCYYYNSQMNEAKNTYSKLFNSSDSSINPEVYFRYAHALKGGEFYNAADKIMSDYLGQEVNTYKFIEKLKNTIPYNYKVKALNSGSQIGDFGVSYFGDKIVFASQRNMENPEYAWNNKPYLDLYTATITEDKDLENIVPFSDDINTKMHESNATFTKDGKTMYFSRTSDKRIRVNEEKYAVVKIYRAEFVDGTWTNVTEMPFSSDTYSTQHPVLNDSNTKLYFSSDMPSSLGSFDIFYVEITGDNYSAPVNLGNVINTKHREQFPFISKDNTLYFASNGHEGLGGLDVFMATAKDTSFETPMNLGTTINTGMDDFGFILNDSMQEGFFSSNRDGVDKLYAFTPIENIRVYTVKGDVRDKKTKALLPDTKVSLLNDDGSIIGDMIVGTDGKYTFKIEPNKVYKIEGHRDFYIPAVEEFDTNEEGVVVFNIELEMESFEDAEEIVTSKTDGYLYIELENIYFDLDKWDIKPQAAKTLDVLVNLLNKYPRMEIQLGAHTDSRSSDAYNLKLSDNRAKATLDYLVSNGIDKNRLQSKGFGESQPLVNCGENCTEDEHAINRRCEFIIMK